MEDVKKTRDEKEKQILDIIHAINHATLEELQELIYRYGSQLREKDIRERQLFVYMVEFLRHIEYYHECETEQGIMNLQET